MSATVYGIVHRTVGMQKSFGEMRRFIRTHGLKPPRMEFLQAPKKNMMGLSAMVESWASFTFERDEDALAFRLAFQCQVHHP